MFRLVMFRLLTQGIPGGVSLPAWSSSHWRPWQGHTSCFTASTAARGLPGRIPGRSPLPKSARALCRTLSRAGLATGGSSIVSRQFSVADSSDSLERFYDKPTNVVVYPILQASQKLERLEQIFKGNGHRLALIATEPVDPAQPPLHLRHAECGVISILLGESRGYSLSMEQQTLLESFFSTLMTHRWRRGSREMYLKLRDHEDYHSAIPPYLVGLVGGNDELDWSFMQLLLDEAQRSEEERTKAAHSLQPPSAPRLWNPCYEGPKTYICYGPTKLTCADRFPGTIEDVETYLDYFQHQKQLDFVSAETPLFEAQLPWAWPSNLPIHSDSIPLKQPKVRVDKSEYNVCRELGSVKLPLGACAEAPLANSHVALLATMLPQYLYFYERHQNAKALLEHCRGEFPTLYSCLSKLPREQIMNALTAKSCALDDSFEKLEWIGDAVLKLVQTDTLVKSTALRDELKDLSEGDLTRLRQAMGSNYSLIDICRNLGLYKFLMTIPLSRGQWLPSCLDFSEGSVMVERSQMGDKMYADVVESLLGLVYLEYDYNVALAVADELSLTPTWTEQPQLSSQAKGVRKQPKLLETLERCLGYSEFKQRNLLEEAFAHPSLNDPEKPSYQRLEWIGDAVLCFAIREWVYVNFPEMELGDMVLLESALVSNKNLGFLSWKSGLHKFLRQKEQKHIPLVDNYINIMKGKNGDGVWEVDPPKAISDVVESVFGAIFMDGGFAAGHDAVLRCYGPLLHRLVKRRDNGGFKLEDPEAEVIAVVRDILRQQSLEW